MSRTKKLLGLDVGSVRIGAAIADSSVRIAVPHDTIPVDGNELRAIAQLVVEGDIDTIVVGYPRNQSGEPTSQTAAVETFAESLKDMADRVEFQDESLTSVLAEKRLEARGAPYDKADIDAEAAAIILQDYMEQWL
ncbi:MAG TPA: Holliday junction resolvase RuvX [Candidatus Saccharibacteria bacterium]|nr:Holliday junction resolvase RuvX [Candidatus Saccharibacteria bacterium]HRK94531.1 Holliday junction resolvase RuvX [Candidatus Saccharibacteria bacterium]